MTTAATNLAAIPLIPREVLFGNPVRSGGKISPDGQWLSWMAPLDGVMNVWLAPYAAPEQARAMTRATERPIPQYFWSPDSTALLYVQDKAGDENFLLYRVDVATGKESCLTPFDDTRARIVGSSETIRDKLLVGLNNRDPMWHDVYLLDLTTGALELVLENHEWAGFEADDSLILRWAVRQNEAGGTDMHQIVDGVIAETPREVVEMDDALTTSTDGYTTDGTTLYWFDSRGRDTAALYAEDVATGERTLIAEDPRADIGGTMRHTRTGVVQAYAVTYLQTEWHCFDHGIKASLDWLRDQLDGDFGVQSRTDDDRKWLVWNDPLTAPTRCFIYDRELDSLSLFYVTKPELDGAPLQPMKCLEIPARDGLTLPSYLTLPAHAQGPVPMVLLVHGGPWARDGYGFNRTHQWLANRGYGVLSVNFRGSTGFGKHFTNAGNLQWSKTMHDDLIDAVEWAVAQGHAARDKVAIMGGSYGGYATLVGLTYTPELFACGVDIVGPSPYWAPMVKQFHERMGDPTTPEGLQLLKDCSPIHRADRIVRPLLIGQGANDPRVKQSESDQIVAAMQGHGIPVTYVLFPDEGHGFHRPENNIAFNAVVEGFLATVLGGRAEPLGEALAASTAQILTGEDMVQGLG
jgi:dipeptidyl aminopeptidase/acylaminoacyl peptidase